MNVDPAVADGSPAAISQRKYAVAAQQIGGNPTIFQVDAQQVHPEDQTVDGSLNPTIKAMPTGSYNAALYKQLSAAMKVKLMTRFP